MFIKAVINISSLTMLSRITGFARDICMSWIVGAGPMADAFIIALKLPNLFRRLFAEGAFGVSFIPMYAEYVEKNEKEQATLFAAQTLSCLISILIPLVTFMIIAMPYLMYLLAPGFSDEPLKFDMALTYSRITFPYLFFISIAALMGGMLNSYHYYGPFSATSIFFNLIMVAGLWIAYYTHADYGLYLSYSLTVSGLVQVFWMIFWMRYRGIKLHLAKPTLSPEIRKLFRLIGPGALGAGLMQINLFIDIVIASLLPTGAISYLYYADRLNQLPLGVIGVAIGTALLPILSKLMIRGEREVIINKIYDSIVFSLMISLPATIAFVSIPELIFEVLFERGKFTSVETMLTAKALAAYSIGIPAYILSKVYSTCCFAQKDTKTPVKIAALVIFLNAALAFFLIHFYEHVGIAIATAATAWLNMILLRHTVEKKLNYAVDPKTRKRIFLTLMASLIMGAYLLGLKYYFYSLFAPHSLGQLMALVIMILTSIALYFSLVFMFGVYRLQEIKKYFVRKKE